MTLSAQEPDVLTPAKFDSLVPGEPNNQWLQKAVSNPGSKQFVYPSEMAKQLMQEEVPMDTSEEYIHYMQKTFESFKPILNDQTYNHYSPSNQMIGVVNLLKEDLESKRMFLRSLIASQLEFLNELVLTKGTDDGWVLNYIQLINVINLINALRFGQDDEVIVLLQHWIQTATVEPELLEVTDEPYGSPTFWSHYVKGMLLRGDFGKLIDDLKASNYEHLKPSDPELFNLIDKFILLLSGYDPISFSLDLNLFLKWKQLVINLKDSIYDLEEVQNKSILNEINDLLGLISGTNSIENYCEQWYESFMAHYLYQLPSKNKLEEYLYKSMPLATQDEEMDIDGSNTWDSICIDVINEKYLNVITGMESLDTFISTFITILLKASGLLNSYTAPLGIDQMINDLSMTLIQVGKKPLFELAIGILIEINLKSLQEILREILPRYPIDQREDFEWVLSICYKYELDETIKEIYNIQGELLFQRGFLYESFYCLSEGNSQSKLIAYSWKVFEMVLVERKLQDKTLIMKIEQEDGIRNPMIRQALSPLVCLYRLVSSSFDDLWLDRWTKLMAFRYLHIFYKPALIFMIKDQLEKLSVQQLVQVIETLDTFEIELEQQKNQNEKCIAMYELVSGGQTDFSLSQFLQQTRQNISQQLAVQFIQDV